jgi:hypothetical protein
MPGIPGSPAARREIALAEYTTIKAEQTARIGFRDNLIYAAILAVAGALTITHSAHSSGYLLAVPAAVFVLGWTYLANDTMISAIGRHFGERPDLPGLAWEADHPGDTRRVQRKAIQLAVDLTTFCGSGAAALVAFWTAPGPAPLLLAVSAAETAALAVLAWQFIISAPVPLLRGKAQS